MKTKHLYSTEVAFDLETDGFTRKIVCVCAVSSNGHRIDARSLSDYERYCIQCGLFREDARHWAHWGGIFDTLHVLPFAFSRGWELDRCVVGPGGNAWAVDLSRGKHRWRIRDSARIIPDSLRSIGVAFGLEKGELERGSLTAYDYAEILRYCYRDCDVLLKALLYFRDLFSTYGVPMGDTLAGSAAQIARNLQHKPRWHIAHDIDWLGQKCYYGGRVERFRANAASGAVYDINSAYPAGMCTELPTYFIKSGSGKPPSDTYNLIRARVKVDKNATFGPLPYRPESGSLKGRLVFPVGEWTGYYTEKELQVAAENGDCTYEPLEFWAFESAAWLRELVAGWYQKRLRTESKAEKYALKILMNSLYGKFIESPEGGWYTTNQAKALRAEAKGARITHHIVAGKVVYEVSDLHTGIIRHAPTAASVTAHARCTLLRAMRSASRVDYCDTDSIIGKASIADSKIMGEFKREFDFTDGEFLASKLYKLCMNNGVLVKAKGFGRVEDMSALWESIKKGETVTRESTVLFRTQLRAGELGFSRVEKPRKRHENVEKRCFFPHGESRPWDTCELPYL